MVANVIPVMDAIDEVLTPNLTASEHSPAINAALELGKQTLNRYYSKTDESEVYRAAMGKFNIFMVR